jgi:hypothetical protein
MKDISVEELKMSYPDVALAMETVVLEEELVNKLRLDGHVRRSDSKVEIVVQLSGNYELVISPALSKDSEGSTWGGSRVIRSEQLKESVEKYVISAVCQLRSADARFKTIAEFRVEATSLERLIAKFLYSVEKVCKKRLVALPIETIN